MPAPVRGPGQVNAAEAGLLGADVGNQESDTHGRLVTYFTTESTENTEVGKEEGVGNGANPTFPFPIRLCDLCDLCGEKS